MTAPAASPAREGGFSLIEVLVTLAILGYAVVAFQTSVGVYFDTAVTTACSCSLVSCERSAAAAS